MPLLIPVVTGLASFAAGFYTSEKWGWLFWLLVAAVVLFFVLKLLGVF